METTAHIIRHLRAVYFGGNWTAVNLKETLTGLTWEQATTRVHSFNTIAALVYHINYYVCAITTVLEGNPLEANDKYSFELPSIRSQQDWENLLEKIWNDAEKLAVLIGQFPENRLNEFFVEEKYGTYFRNFIGVIEHIHYHLGQMVLIKKIILENK